jgi:hypothetical protein
MKIVLLLVAALSFFGLISYNVKQPNLETESLKADEIGRTESVPTPESLPAKGKSPILIELFTSEGCSSCPPADKNLIYLDKKQPFEGAEVITLAMHVDYWNRLGWTDPFSAAKYSERQSLYSDTFKLDGVYTPQMVVDGDSQFVGSSLNEAQKAVSEAVKVQKAVVALSVSDNKLQVKISDLPKHSAAKVFVAVAEDNLSTAVKNGENGGRTLPHTSVVRELKIVGAVKAEDKNFETETAFQLQPSWKKQNLKLVVFVQIEQTNQIIGVSQIRL